MRTLSSLLIFLSSIASAVPTCSASASALPEPGTRVRLTARMPGRERWIGPLSSIERDTVTMRIGDMYGALVAVPTQNVTRFEVSRGRGRSGFWTGTGAVAGAFLGGAVALLGYQLVQPCCKSGGGFAQTVVGSVIGGAAGGAVGGIPRSEHWRALPLEDLRGTRSQ